MWAWEMPKGRRTIGNLSLFDIKSWSDYIQPTYWTSAISWHSWQYIHIERNKIWSDQARSWVSACIKMIRGLRSQFFFLRKNCHGLTLSHNHLCFLAKYVKRFPNTESCWVNHSAQCEYRLLIPGYCLLTSWPFPFHFFSLLPHYCPSCF